MCRIYFSRSSKLFAHKIRESWRQFESYSDHTCCLILYNAGSFTVSLQPELILCAMFGEYSKLSVP